MLVLEFYINDEKFYFALHAIISTIGSEKDPNAYLDHELYDDG